MRIIKLNVELLESRDLCSVSPMPQDVPGFDFLSHDAVGASPFDRQAVAAQITGSAEYRGLEVHAVYQELLHRDADPLGQAYWGGLLAGGSTVEDVEAGILSSDEYTGGHESNGSFLSGLYADLLHRGTDPSASIWQQQLDNGTPRATVAGEMLASSERFGIVLGRYYDAAFSRPVDGSGYNYWQAQYQAGTRLEGIFAGIAASNEGYTISGSLPAEWTAYSYQTILGRHALPSEITYWLQSQGGSSQASGPGANDPPGNPYPVIQSESSIALTGSGAVVAFNDSGSLDHAHEAANNGVLSGLSVSTNGSKTYTDLGAPPAGRMGDLGDPTVQYDPVSHTTYYFSLTYGEVMLAGPGMNCYASTDDGQTWTLRSSLADSLDPSWNLDLYVFDKPSVVVDNTPGPGQGTICAFYRMYPIFTGSQHESGIYMQKSTDHGQTWSDSQEIIARGPGDLDEIQGVRAAVGSNHEIDLCYYQAANNVSSLQFLQSTDGGATWGSAPTQIVQQNVTYSAPNGDLGMLFRTSTFPSMAVSGSNIYVTYDDPSPDGKDAGNIYFVRSYDNGKTWSAPTRLDHDGGNSVQFQPSVTVSPDGTHIAAAWYAADPTGQWFDAYATTGAILPDGSVVWSQHDERLTPWSQQQQLGLDPIINPQYGSTGDYQDMVSDNAAAYVPIDLTDSGSPQVQVAVIPF